MTVPIRAKVLTAASTAIYDIMETLYADIVSFSTWTSVHQTAHGNPVRGNGSNSFAIRAPDNSREINFSNESLTPAAADTAAFRVGVNPDGSSDPIVDSTDPHGGGGPGAANYSGTDRGRALTLASVGGDPAIGHAEFIVIEWTDAIMLIFKDATRTYPPKGVHAGACLLNPMTSLADPGGSSILKMDGNSILGSAPGYTGAASAEHWSAVNSGNFAHDIRRRIADGQTSDLNDLLAPWCQEGLITGNAHSGAVLLYQTGDLNYRRGPNDERMPTPIFLTASGTSDGAELYLYKYLRSVPAILPPFSIYQVAGVNRYMVLGSQTLGSGNNANLAVPIPAGFNPNP
jgi:hypothetical protein